MADSVTMEVLGMKELIDNIKALNLDVNVEARKAIFAGAYEVKKTASQLAPVLAEPTKNRTPGTLRARVRVIKLKDRGTGWHNALVRVKRLTKGQISKYKKATGKFGKDNPNDPFYWWWVEFGTAKMKARPFIRPAFESKKETVVEIIKRRLAARIKKENKRRGIK